MDADSPNQKSTSVIITKTYTYTKIPIKNNVRTYLQLSGAEKRWKDPRYKDTMYLPGLALAGNPEELRTYLSSTFDVKKINSLFEQAYTLENVQNIKSVKERFQADLNNIKSRRVLPIKEKKSYSMTDLKTIGDWLGETDKPSTPKHPKHNEIRKIIQTYLKDLKEGEAIDITQCIDDKVDVKLTTLDNVKDYYKHKKHPVYSANQDIMDILHSSIVGPVKEVKNKGIGREAKSDVAKEKKAPSKKSLSSKEILESNKINTRGRINLKSIASEGLSHR